MDFRNCLRCKKIFNYISGPTLCKECDKYVFDIIKEYLEENPSSTISQISETTKIPSKIIRQYIKDQRLMEIRKKLNLCVICGEIIDEGSKYCVGCAKKISIVNQLENTFNEKKDDSPKMRFLTNNRYKR